MADELAHGLLEPLLEPLWADVRQVVERRFSYLERRMDYFVEVGESTTTLLLETGFDLTRLKVICGLNAFYQVVLSPLASSARDEFPGGLGSELPITYGSERFDADRVGRVRYMMAAFRGILRESRIPPPAMEANLLEDILGSLLRAAPEEDDWEIP